MIYLVELEPYSKAAGANRILRYCKAQGRGYVTEPTDMPANTSFEERVSDPGNYERFLFSRGRTRGESTVGGGDIVLVNADRALDFMLSDDLAFDGRPVRIYALPDDRAAWADRMLIFVGTMEQVVFTARHVEVRIRDRLAALRKTIQTERFKGTTTDGSKKDAEGGEDLKDVLVPEVFGTVRLVTPIMVDAFNRVFRAARRLDGIVNAWDRGIRLTPTQDYPTIAGMYGATLQVGQYATCLAKGMLRTQVMPESLTLDVYTGATLAQRSAARIVQGILPVDLPVSVGDFDALHAANPAECGLWTGTGETQILAVAMAFMNTVGASLNVDRLGVFRTKRLELPTGPGVLTLDNDNILDDGDAFARLAPQDDGDGLPALSVTVRWGRAYTTYRLEDLRPGDNNVSAEFRSFATLELRQEIAESAANKALHPEGPTPIFDTLFAKREDAQAEAHRLLPILGAKRSFFDMDASADEVAELELGDVVTLAPTRFGMAQAGGVPARAMGLVSTLSSGTVEVEVWR